ncbi:hypothetical protein [Streptomyces flaveolus]|uniref:Uncharacterized protein n=1 Tax=Streptomyces flaveolus TaxID=67297 RepID=A0ABV3APQ1_9ACTN|nr:hypothetical protein [Streptomyces flaveolus]
MARDRCAPHRTTAFRGVLHDVRTGRCGVRIEGLAHADGLQLGTYRIDDPGRLFRTVGANCAPRYL